MEQLEKVEVVHKTASMSLKTELMVKRLVSMVRNKRADRAQILEMIGKAFKAELGYKTTNVILDEDTPKKIFINTTDESKLYPVLEQYCYACIEDEARTKEVEERAKWWVSEFMKDWREGQPQPIKPNPTQSKGRPSKPFKDIIIDDADGCKLQKMHLKMDGKKGKAFALMILVCIKKGWILRPTYTQAKNEFGDIGSNTIYNRYLKEQMFSKEELEGAINSLD